MCLFDCEGSLLLFNHEANCPDKYWTPEFIDNILCPVETSQSIKNKP